MTKGPSSEFIKEYLREIGRRGGKSRSRKKLAAVAKNLRRARAAKKGGAR